MLSTFSHHKKRAIELRRLGKSYGEINNFLNAKIPKSTLSHWFRNIYLSEKQKNRINLLTLDRINTARVKAIAVNKAKRNNYLKHIREKVVHLPIFLNNKDVAKTALGMLYLGEGSKTRRGALMFGNSSPDIIKLFLKLLRNCYDIDESKFRCTVQFRADQNPKILEEYWSYITKISKSHFYKTSVDMRTVGKPSRKPEYKGVCRIDYFSADIYNELIILCDLFK